MDADGLQGSAVSTLIIPSAIHISFACSPPKNFFKNKTKQNQTFFWKNVARNENSANKTSNLIHLNSIRIEIHTFICINTEEDDGV